MANLLAIACGCATTEFPEWVAVLEPETDLVLEVDDMQRILWAYPHQSKLCEVRLCDRPELGKLFPPEVGIVIEDRIRVTRSCGHPTAIDLTWPSLDAACVARARISPTAGGARILLREQTRRRLTPDLANTPEDFWQLFDAAPIPLAVEVARDAGEEGISRVNRKFREVFGYDEHDVPSVQHWWPRAYPDPSYRDAVRERWFEAVRAAHDATQPIVMETTVTCKNGTKRDIEFGVAAIGNRHVVTFVDLTESRTAQRALAARVAELGKALAEIRRLRGLLPVCAWCHKLRDDQGYWHDLEEFFAHSTELTVTHGICPDCRGRHFASM